MVLTMATDIINGPDIDSICPSVVIYIINGPGNAKLYQQWPATQFSLKCVTSLRCKSVPGRTECV